LLVLLCLLFVVLFSDYYYVILFSRWVDNYAFRSLGESGNTEIARLLLDDNRYVWILIRFDYQVYCFSSVFVFLDVISYLDLSYLFWFLFCIASAIHVVFFFFVLVLLFVLSRSRYLTSSAHC
jgi:hypothetical protein